MPPLDPAAALSYVARRARIPDLDVSVFRQRELDKDANGFSLGIKLPLWNANRGEITRAEADERIAAAAAAREGIDVLTELEARLTDLVVAPHAAGVTTNSDEAGCVRGRGVPSVATAGA